MAWAAEPLRSDLQNHPIVAVKRLHLDQDACVELVSGLSYALVFNNALMRLPGLEPSEFFVVHAKFQLYTLGLSVIDDFAVIAKPASGKAPELSLVITHAAKLLRGEI